MFSRGWNKNGRHIVKLFPSNVVMSYLLENSGKGSK